MGKIIKYTVTAVLSIAAVFFIVKNVNGVFPKELDSYVNSINAEVEAKRSELLSTGVFHDGIKINGVSIGGMTYDQAKEALKPVEDDLIKDVGFILEYGDDQKLDIGLDYFTVTYDTDSILKKAIALATEGSLESIRQQIDDLAKNGKEYDIDCKVEIDAERVTEAVKEIGDSLYVKPKNATCNPVPDSVYNGGERFTYKEGKKGYKAKTDEAIEEILTRAESGDYGTVVLKGKVLKPDVKLSDLEGKIVLRSKYRSSYGFGNYNAPNRVFNIEKACALVNGYVLPPKDKSDSSNKDHIFSMNDTLGPRTEARGWLPAPGFVNGGANSVDSPGGGVCHVSSTLYNAVVKADLKIVFRLNHSSHVGYVPWGLDATIYTGGTDFKFANNTKSPLYIFMWVDSKKQEVCCEIWGEPFPEKFDYIDFYSELQEEIPPTETVYIETKELEAPYWYIKNREKTGYKYISYKQYYKDGEPVGDPVTVAVSNYRMHPRRICVWVGFDPEVDVLDKDYRLEPPQQDS
ncbi:MAG: VanW family protein [Clostridiales bacterium]|nr:VanW family protein [Clostridiales bacterium]